jgi:hypothetical protein
MMPINRSAQHHGETVLYVKQDFDQLMTRMKTVEETLFVIPKPKIIKKKEPEPPKVIDPRERKSTIPSEPYKPKPMVRTKFTDINSRFEELETQMK